MRDIYEEVLLDLNDGVYDELEEDPRDEYYPEDRWEKEQ